MAQYTTLQRITMLSTELQALWAKGGSENAGERLTERERGRIADIYVALAHLWTVQRHEKAGAPPPALDAVAQPEEKHSTPRFFTRRGRWERRAS